MFFNEIFTQKSSCTALQRVKIIVSEPTPIASYSVFPKIKNQIKYALGRVSASQTEKISKYLVLFGVFSILGEVSSVRSDFSAVQRELFHE